METRLAKLMQSYQRFADRASNRLKMSQNLLLIVSVLGFCFLGNFCNAQVTNQLVFERLVLQSVAASGCSIDSLTGFLTTELEGKIIHDVTDGWDLQVESPTIDFTRIDKRRFARVVESVLIYKDSIEIGAQVLFRDTVEVAQLSKVRKSSYPELRGQNPRATAKFLAPALLIGTGIAGIILLFYLRS